MQIGLCVPPEKLEMITRYGFDYAEIPVESYALLPEADFSALLGRVCSLGIEVPAGNFFFPGKLRLTGPAVDRERVLAYIRVAVERAARLGVRVLVVGSGQARSAPEGFSKAEAVRQFGEFAARIGDAAAPYGISALLECIRPDNSNILNTLAECGALVAALAHPQVGLMADFLQMRGSGEGMSSIVNTVQGILHAHISNSHNTLCPISREEDDYDAFFAVLKQIGYRGRLTVETACYEEGKLSPRLLRELAVEYFGGERSGSDGFQAVR